MEKKVHPELKEIFALMPKMPISLQSLKDIRAGIAEQISQPNAPESPNVETIEKIVPGTDGNPDVRVLIHRPKNQADVLPGIYYIHGGGYILGTAEMFSQSCEHYAEQFNCVVVNVDYRLAPEHPYPAPIEDCYSGLKWFAEHADELNVDPERIVVVGASAGGGLTAALTLLARDRKGPKIAAQFPLYPMIDDRCNTASNEEITDERVWNGAGNRAAWDMYLGDLKDADDVPIYAAPARAEDYSDLPPTFTCIGDLDPFRDETITYVQKLRQSDVPTEFHLYPGGFHGFESFAPQASISQQLTATFENALNNALHIKQASTI
ncbi:alpha/beta hydrolase [Solibacillus silvestris]|uniref:alpha/beta hydrolase n=1 Tax=Solibacillus silvestris TaxID=76853 RepID=UPI003F7DD3EA